MISCLLAECWLKGKYQAAVLSFATIKIAMASTSYPMFKALIVPSAYMGATSGVHDVGSMLPATLVQCLRACGAYCGMGMQFNNRVRMGRAISVCFG